MRRSWRRCGDGEGRTPWSVHQSVVEEAALGWLASRGYEVLHGPEIAAGEPCAERTDSNFRDVVLERRLRRALTRLNPNLPPEALDDALRKLDGVNVECGRKDGSIVGARRGSPTSRTRRTTTGLP